MSMLLSILFVFGLNAVVFQVAGQCPSADTSSGPVQGKSACTAGKQVPYSSFQGIRYGQPPVGNLRYKPPCAAEKSSKVCNCTAPGPVCPQLADDGSYIGDEDCLFLNVHTPVTDLKNKPSKLKPVLVHINGQEFSKGSGDPELFGPDYFIEYDVIVVTFNYRVGSLGFLALDEEDCAGNAGLKDQRLALQWVQENIINFGGDPDCVTLIGQNSGSTSVLYHSVSAGSQGLFHRVISMSGSPLNPTGLQSSKSAEENAYQLGSILGKDCSNKRQLLNHLRKQSAEDIVLSESKLGYVNPPFRPVIENPEYSSEWDAILTVSVEERYKSGECGNIPHLLGGTKDESLIYVGRDSYRSEVIDLAKSYAEATNNEYTIPAVYWENSIWNCNSELIKETTDLLYTTGVEQHKRLIQNYGSGPIYYYSMSYAPKNLSYHQNVYKISQDGCCNGDDIPYLFYSKSYGMPQEDSHPACQVRSKMTRMWSNFAKCGNPTPDDDDEIDVKWPEHRASGKHVDIGNKCTIKNKSCNSNVDSIISNLPNSQCSCGSSSCDGSACKGGSSCNCGSSSCDGSACKGDSSCNCGSSSCDGSACKGDSSCNCGSSSCDGSACKGDSSSSGSSESNECD